MVDGLVAVALKDGALGLARGQDDNQFGMDQGRQGQGDTVLRRGGLSRGGMQDQPGAGRVEALFQHRVAGEQRADVAVRTHTQQDGVERLQRGDLEVGGPGAVNRVCFLTLEADEPGGGGAALQQALAHQPGVGLGRGRVDPAFIRQGDGDVAPVEVGVLQAVVDRPWGRAAGDAEVGRAPFDQGGLQTPGDGGAGGVGRRIGAVEHLDRRQVSHSRRGPTAR